MFIFVAKRNIDKCFVFNLIKNTYIMDIQRVYVFYTFIHKNIYVYYIELKVGAFIIAFGRLNIWTVVTIGHGW